MTDNSPPPLRPGCFLVIFSGTFLSDAAKKNFIFGEIIFFRAATKNILTSQPDKSQD
jgi:hypothetical protein